MCYLKKLATGLTLWVALISSGQAIINFSEDGRNLTPPEDPALRALWDAHGSWQGATGVVVADHWFITALHLGGGVGGYFDLNHKSYPVVEVAHIPNTDLMLFRVAESLPNAVELWDESCGNELKHAASMFGRGTMRGQEILLPNGSKPGWRWGASDGKLSWGTNVVDEFFDAGPTLGSILVWAWNREAGEAEGTLSSGDSGGGLFLKDTAGHWRLAGIHFDVDPSVGGKETQYALTDSGDESFWAAIHDGRGLWRGLLGERFRAVGQLEDHPAPMWSGATRIAPQAALIRSIIAPGSSEAAKYPPPMIIWGKHKILAVKIGAALLVLALGWWIWRRLNKAR